MFVDTWLQYPAYSDNPAAAARELAAAGISTASLMVNPFPGIEPAEFPLRPRERIEAMIHACRAEGIQVRLTSWVQPYESYIRGAAEKLLPLLEQYQDTVNMVEWDAEECWVRAEHHAGWVAASELIAELFEGHRMGVTGIGSGPDEVGPLAQRCDWWLPQAYATTKNGSDPYNVVQYSYKRWSRWGQPGGGYIFGLAGFRQPEDAQTAMARSIESVKDLPIEADRVCYWDWGQIRQRTDVLGFITRLSSYNRINLDAPIMQALDIGHMSSSADEAQQAVLIVQALLGEAWGVDPGPYDGQPGAKTLAAVEHFQTRAGLPVTGVVDAATWCALIRAPLGVPPLYAE
jgi:hypothetical protein